MRIDTIPYMKPPELDAEKKKCLDEVFERVVSKG